MVNRRILARNMIWNAGGVVCDAITSFVIAPFLVFRLGDTTYGLWLLIGSLSSYFGLLDIGVRSSVGRFVAFHRAANDRARVNSILSSALLICLISGCAVIALSFAIQALFFHVFEVPADQVVPTRWALWLICVNLALTFPLSLPDGMLWAAQRFDTLSKVDIPATVLRALLTYWVVRRGDGLVGLAFVTLGLTVAVAVVKGFLAFREDPEARIHWSSINRESITSLFGYGKWNTTRTVSIICRTQLITALIGSTISVARIAFYSFPRRLLSYSEAAIVSSTGVLIPLATTLHSQGHSDRQRSLFIQGGKFNSLIAFFFLGFYYAIGRELLVLWLGPRFGGAGDLLMILSVGETLPFAQLTTVSILLAMARNRAITILAILEVIPILALGFPLAKISGLTGLCIVLAASGAIFRGVAILIYGCRVMEVELSTYIRKVLIPSCLAALVPALVLKFIVFTYPPRNWVHFFSYCLIYSGFCLISILVLLGKDEVRSLRLAVQKRFAT